MANLITTSVLWRKKMNRHKPCFLKLNVFIMLWLMEGIVKELSFCHKLKFSNPYICSTWWRKPLKIGLPEFYDIEFQRYKAYKIRDCGKHSVLLVKRQPILTNFFYPLLLPLLLPLFLPLLSKSKNLSEWDGC